MYGTQTKRIIENMRPQFENDVKMYGTQTIHFPAEFWYVFENDVKMYGTQTPPNRIYRIFV